MHCFFSYSPIIRAKRDIMAGESITLSYVDTLKPTPLRREQLHRDKKFWCECARCIDPTEFGSNCSALSCPKCKGPVLPGGDNDGESWACNDCANYSIVASKAGDILLDSYRGKLESTVLDAWKSWCSYLHPAYLQRAPRSQAQA